MSGDAAPLAVRSSFPGSGRRDRRASARFSIAFVGAGAVGAAAAETAVRAGFGATDARRPRRRRAVEPRAPVSLRRRGRRPDRAQGRGGGGAPLARSIPPSRCAPSSRTSTPSNAREILAGHDVVFDGSDNFETRLLVSDAARALGRPSIYAACVGAEGRVAVSVPGRTPCLRCYLEELPPPGSGPTCDTVGVVPTLPPLVASARDDGGAAPRVREGAVARDAGPLGVGRRLRLAAPVRGRPAVAGLPGLRAAVASRRSRARARRSSSSSAAASPSRCGPAARSRPDFDAARAPALAARPRPALAAAPERGRRGRQPDDLPRRPLRRARDRRPAAGALALRPLRRRLSVRRIPLEDLLASPEEIGRARASGSPAGESPRSRPRPSTGSPPIRSSRRGRRAHPRGQSAATRRRRSRCSSRRGRISRPWASTAPPATLDAVLRALAGAADGRPPAPRADRRLPSASPTLAVRMPAHASLRRLLDADRARDGDERQPLGRRAAASIRTRSTRSFDGEIDVLVDGGRTPGGLAVDARRRDRRSAAAAARGSVSRGRRRAPESVLNCAFSWVS